MSKDLYLVTIFTSVCIAFLIYDKHFCLLLECCPVVECESDFWLSLQ
jgi:hypothetical protein